VIGRAFHPTEPLRLVPEPAQREEYETVFDDLEEAMNDTTRRFKRSMHGADGAFPRDPQYAHALCRIDSECASIARHHSLRERLIDALWWAIGCVLLAFLIVLWFRGGPFA
jgi:hypothetical protein